VAVLLLAGGFLVPKLAWGQVVPSSPTSTPPIDGPIPSLVNATGPLFEAPIFATDPNSVHEGRFTWGPDLFGPGTPLRTFWTAVQFAAPGNPFEFTAAPALQTHVNAALASADGKLSQIDAGGIGALFSSFADLVSLTPGAHATFTLPTGPKQKFFGYLPVRSRWLRSQWVPTQNFVITPWGPWQKYTSSDYYPFGDIRLRGARFYCAARRAEVEQNGSRLSLGERVGFSVGVLGQQIDFMVVEPTLSLDGASKFFGSGDGAQAFTIPLLLGTAVDPIRGLLPTLGEAKVPVVFVSADTEVRTEAERKSIFIPGGPLKLTPTHTKEYHTVTHSDAVLSAGFYDDQRFSANADFLLFTVGPLNVRALLGLDYGVGAFHVNDTAVPDDRVLFWGDPSAPPPGWPTRSRSGRSFVNLFSGTEYHDGAWALAAHRGSPYFQWEVQPDGPSNPLWTFPVFPIIRPHDLRALTDDDHVVSSATQLDLTVGLRGELGVSTTKPFEVTVHVEGSFTGGVTQHTLLRDALMAQAPAGVSIMRPFTSLTARPRQTAQVTFSGLQAGLHFYLDLGFFGSIDFEKTFIDTPAVNVADYDTDDSLAPADEQTFLRLGTGATAGIAMTQPNVLSHLPGRTDFKTFLQNVPACLADNAPPPPQPEDCTPTQSTGTPPGVNLCLYGPELPLQENFLGQLLPPNACSNIQGWLAALDLSAGKKLCLTKYLSFLCSPVSKEQSWNGVNVVSRVWNLDPGMNSALLGIVDECALAFMGTDVAPDDPAVHDAVTDMASGFIGVAACSSDATLIPDSQIITAINPTTPPAAQPGQICK
jgi:hypothetical protein